MKKILVLKSSIMGNDSQTNSLIDRYLAERRAKGYEDQIVEHDLTALDLPVLDGELFSALRGADNISPRAKAAVALSDRLIAELKGSDLLLIGAPMYNLNVPTQLKNWFDLVARARLTFNYTTTYPVGLVEGMRHPNDADSVPGFRNARFSRSKHCLPAIVEQIWQGREAAKRQHNKPLSQALKIIMNALYGVLGSSGCRFFDPRLASSITLRGHEIMRQTRELIEAEGYQVIYGDTDSTFVWLKQPHDEQQAAQIGRALVQRVNAWWQQHLQQQFGLENALELEFETHYSRFLMPTIRGAEQGSKKRYAGLIARGGGEEEMVYKGLETVRTDWTPLAQQFQQQLYQRIFKRQPYQDYVRDYVGKTLNGDFDDQLVYRKRLRRKLDDYQRNVPPHARAARIADDYNRSQGRPLQYQNGGWISYVMTVAGPEPLETRHSPIDYQHYLERQLQPVADAILPFLHDDFTTLVTGQMGLF